MRLLLAGLGHTPLACHMKITYSPPICYPLSHCFSTATQEYVTLITKLVLELLHLVPTVQDVPYSFGRAKTT